MFLFRTLKGIAVLVLFWLFNNLDCMAKVPLNLLRKVAQSRITKQSLSPKLPTSCSLSNPITKRILPAQSANNSSLRNALAHLKSMPIFTRAISRKITPSTITSARYGSSLLSSAIIALSETLVSEAQIETYDHARDFKELKDLFIKNTENLGTWCDEDWLQENSIAVIRHNNRLCGFIIYSQAKDEGRIYYIAIQDHVKNRGLGKKLLLHALKDLESHQAKHTTLAVYAHNTVAQNCYKKIGFEPIVYCLPYGIWYRYIYTTDLIAPYQKFMSRSYNSIDKCSRYRLNITG